MNTLVKTTLIITGIILLLAIVALFFLNPYLEKKIADNLSQQLPPYLTLQYDGLNVNAFTGNASMENIHLIADSTKWDTAQAYLPFFFHIKLQKIEIKDVNIIKLLTSDVIKVGRFYLSSPDIALYQNHKNGSKAAKRNKQGKGKEIWIKNAEVDNGKFSFHTNQHQLLSVDYFSVAMENLSLSSLLNDSALTDNLYSSSSFNMQNFKFLQEDSVREITIANINFLGGSNYLQIDSFNLNPLISPEEMSRIAGWRKTRHKLQADKVEVFGFLEKELFLSNSFLAEKIIVSPLEMNLHQDITYPVNEIRRPPLPQDLLRNASINILIDSVYLNSSNIYYDIKIKPNEDPITITFNDINFAMGNVTNDKARLSKDSTLGVKARAKFMGDAQLIGDFTFHPLDTNGSYKALITMPPTPFNILNPVIKDGSNFAIAGGQVDTATLEFSANRYHANGTMTFLFHDLNIDYDKKKNKGVKDYLKMTALGIGEVLALRKNNPKNGDYNYAQLSVSRDMRKSMFNHWKVIAQEGIIYSIGLKKEVDMLTKNKQE